MDVAIEMHSLSKTFNMTGWRIGMAVGNREILAGLGRVKTNVDSGVFDAVQRAAIAALSGPQDCVVQACRTYQERRDTLVEGLRALVSRWNLRRRPSMSGWQSMTAWHSRRGCSTRQG